MGSKVTCQAPTLCVGAKEVIIIMNKIQFDIRVRDKNNHCKYDWADCLYCLCCGRARKRKLVLYSNSVYKDHKGHYLTKKCNMEEAFICSHRCGQMLIFQFLDSGELY